MSHHFSAKTLTRTACVTALLCLGAVAQAQTASRSIGAKTQPSAPSAAAANGTPKAAGLSSSTAIGNPAGLNSQYPAGLPSTSPYPAGISSTAPAGTVTPSVAAPGTDTSTVTMVDSAGNNVNVQIPNTAISGGPGTPAGRSSGGTGGSGYSAQALASSFIGADMNRDGQLTKGEAARLTIAPYSFEEMDANKDGIVTRSEYEDGVR